MYTKNDISFLFKGINPFHNRVFGLDIQLDRVFCNKICDKKEVTELRKATKKEEELYYKCYPKIDFSILNNTDWFFAVDFLGKTYVFNQNIGYYCITTGEFEGGLQLFQYSIKILRKATEADLVPFYERYPELKLEFNEQGIIFNNIYENNGVGAQIISPASQKYWHLKKDGETSMGQTTKRVHNVEKFFSVKYIIKSKVCNTILGSEKNILFDELRTLSKKELCLAGSYPLDYNFINNKPGYLIGMSVPPVMTAQIAKQVYEQWLSKI